MFQFSQKTKLLNKKKITQKKNSLTLIGTCKGVRNTFDLRNGVSVVVGAISINKCFALHF